MGTKIQINSLEALERLIGGDSEIEVEIRNSIAQEFATKYLKAIASEALKTGATRAMDEIVKDKFMDKLPQGYRFKDEVMKDVYKVLEVVLKIEVESLILEAVQLNVDIERIGEAVEKTAASIAEELREDIIEKRINKRVDEILEGMLKSRRENK